MGSAASRSVWARGTLFMFALGVAAVAFPPLAPAQRVLSLSAGSFSFEVDPGEQITGEVVAINDGTEPIKVLVYSADQTFDEAGAVTYEVPNRDDPDFARRPTAWLRVQMPDAAKTVGNTPYIELDPGQRIPVSFFAQPPVNATPGDHNVVLFFEMFEFSDETGGVVSEVTGRIGSRVQLRVSGEWVERLSVQPFVVPLVRLGSSIPYDFTINNTGNIDQRLSTAVVLLDRNRVEVARDEPLLATVVFADTVRRLEGTVTAGQQLIGRYTVQTEVYQVDDEGRILEAKEPIIEAREVWLVPWWLVIALAVFVLAVAARIVTVVLRRRRGARDRPQVSQTEG